MVRPNLIDLNPVELKCYLFMISLNKCSRSCNVLSPKISIPKKTNDMIVKTFNMTKMKPKQWQNIFDVTAIASSVVQ